MRNRARLGQADANQPPIIRALELVGASVVSTSMVGDGFPDLVVAYRGQTYLMEVKTAKGKLRESQEKFAAGWRGPVHIVRSIADALAVIHQTRPIHVSD